MAKMWDGTEDMDFVQDDGGRALAGFKGRAGDCVARAVTIASQRSYAEVYAALADGNATQRVTKRSSARTRSARNGINVRRKWFRDYMLSLGFRWTPLMKIGIGCTTTLVKGQLPMGRLVVSLSGHYTAVIDGVIHDTYDPQRTTIIHDEKGARLAHRCVYGYWSVA